MSPMPITRKQATHLVRRLPVNRTVSTVSRAGASFGRTARAVLSDPPLPAGVERPERTKNVGADYDTEWARTYPARLARYLVLNGVWSPLVDVFAAPVVHGTDRMADVDGPVIFAANHHSHADTPLMMTAIPEPRRNRLFIGAAADYFFANRITSPLSALFIGAIPVERHRVSRTAIDQSLELLRDDWNMLIFPEGARSPDGWGQQFTAGAAFLSSHSGAPIVPVHIMGTDKVLPKGRNFPRMHPTTIMFGEPMWIGEDEDTKTFAARVQDAVSRLADETTTDWWQASRRAASGETPSLQGPDTGSWRRSWAATAKRRKGVWRSWPRF